VPPATSGYIGSRIVAKSPKSSKGEQLSEPLNEQLNAIDKTVLEAMKENPQIKNEELIIMLGKGRATITRSIKRLREAGLVVRVGAKKNGHWEVQ
jgi:predicted HTH transcriptional regulator